MAPGIRGICSAVEAIGVGGAKCMPGFLKPPWQAKVLKGICTPKQRDSSLACLVEWSCWAANLAALRLRVTDPSPPSLR